MDFRRTLRTFASGSALGAGMLAVAFAPPALAQQGQGEDVDPGFREATEADEYVQEERPLERVSTEEKRDNFNRVYKHYDTDYYTDRYRHIGDPVDPRWFARRDPFARRGGQDFRDRDFTQRNFDFDYPYYYYPQEYRPEYYTGQPPYGQAYGYYGDRDTDRRYDPRTRARTRQAPIRDYEPYYGYYEDARDRDDWDYQVRDYETRNWQEEDEPFEDWYGEGGYDDVDQDRDWYDD